jgi:uncharacterized membrane protein
MLSKKIRIVILIIFMLFEIVAISTLVTVPTQNVVWAFFKALLPLIIVLILLAADLLYEKYKKQ